eukprot:gb/GEZN01006873.1/.p1 GENE.gb/GEZN01006873.1/~~gb/GEZN01006873.1/.p1  ORF type:complete len:464 (+),score=43.61 gb/GEZN01006873.1/:118-1509(+)
MVVFCSSALASSIAPGVVMKFRFKFGDQNSKKKMGFQIFRSGVGGWVCFVVIFATLHVASHQPASRSVRSSKVVDLGDENITDLLSHDKPWFIKFYAPWCNNCIRLAPIWDAFSLQVKDKMHVGQVNCDESPITRSKYQVYSYPTLILEWNGRRLEYSGNRGVRSMLAWLQAEGALTEPSGQADSRGSEPEDEDEGEDEEGDGVSLKEHQRNPVYEDSHHEHMASESSVGLRGRDFRGGGHEAVRLLLAELALDYNETRYSEEAWAELVQKGLDPDEFLLGNTPVYSQDQLYLSGPVTIMRFLGSQYGMIPEDPIALAVFDLSIEGAQGLRQEYESLVFNPNFASLRPSFVTDIIPKRLKAFEYILSLAMSSYLVGAELTVADLYVWDVMTLLLGLDPAILQDSPLLLKWFRNVASRGNLQAYFSSGKRPIYANPESAFFGNSKLPQNDEYPPPDAKTIYHLS